jgi:hypothetical protein
MCNVQYSIRNVLQDMGYVLSVYDALLSFSEMKTQSIFENGYEESCFYSALGR